MNSLIKWAVGGFLLVGAAGLVFATVAPDRGPVFIAGDQPVTEDQVLRKLQADGWSDIRMKRDGRYIEATGTKEGQSTKIAVDAQSGRLRAEDDDDDD